MLEKILNNEIIRTIGIVIPVVFLVLLFIATYLEEDISDINPNSNDENIGSYKTYMSHKVQEFPNGYIVENYEDGLKVIDSNGDIIYETYKKVKYCNRVGYIYEIDKYGRYSIINLKTGETEKSFSKNEIVHDYVAGFWIIKVVVQNDNGITDYSGYYYLLDDNYQIGVNGLILNTIKHESFLDDKDNYICGVREMNYTMYNRDGVEDRYHNGSAVIISDGEIIYTTNENSNVGSIKDGIAEIYFYNDEIEDIYISLKEPNKGQIVKVSKDE